MGYRPGALAVWSHAMNQPQFPQQHSVHGVRRKVADDAGGGPIIDAYRELQELGHFGTHGLRLLLELVGQEVHRFPVLLAPGATWNSDTVADCAQEFFAAKGPAVTAALLAQVTDVASMARYLRRSVRHFLVDCARDTDLGAIRRKIEDLLSATEAFARVPPGALGAGWWQLAGDPLPPYGGDLQPLVAAAYAVPDVQAVRWSGPRRSPLASDASLVEILRAVLSAATGSLEVAQLTAVLVRRFPAAVEYTDASLEEQTFEAAAAPLEDRPDVLLEVSDRAQEVYAQLSPAQRALLPHLDKPNGEQAQILGLGRSQTYAASGKLKAVLVELVPDDGLRAEVTLELYRLCVVNP
ncbi:hypothetical protein DQ238_06615 [Geodermatophilus sp. TF02-6]|nr:hypothetical protein DQ238_06615 [Geodermatophilus sp. TF02-6]